MRTDKHSCDGFIMKLRTAVLLATYNGARFVDAQVRSLRDNSTAFTLHWLDDHSTDSSRETVRVSSRSSGIDLHEWHSPKRRGVPGTFFQLLECVDADIYLFCDQDDVWQPGKIDATVANLRGDIASPVLCFSDPWTFTDDNPSVHRRLSDRTGVKPAKAMEESELLMTTLPRGPKLDRLLCLARLVEGINQRQSPSSLMRLARNGALHPSPYRNAWYTATCLLADAPNLTGD